jgi:hypothetical protein
MFLREKGRMLVSGGMGCQMYVVKICVGEAVLLHVKIAYCIHEDFIYYSLFYNLCLPKSADLWVASDVHFKLLNFV